MKKQLNQFQMWLYYNNWGKVECDDNIEQITEKFIKATSTKGKYCSCKQDKGKAVNKIWNEWHCTYCLKQKALKNGTYRLGACLRLCGLPQKQKKVSQPA